MVNDKSKLQDAFHRFSIATSELKKTYCGDKCTLVYRCENLGICMDAVGELWSASNYGHQVLTEIEQISGAIPAEYARGFYRSISNVLNVLNKMDNSSNEVKNLMEILRIRRDHIKSYVRF